MAEDDLQPAGPEDAELVRQALSGNREAFEILIRRYVGAVYTLALREAPRRSDAEDIAQEAFVKAYNRLSELDDPAAFRGWVRRITVNLARDAARRKSRRMEIGDRSADEDSANIEVPSNDPSISQKFRMQEAREQVIEAIVGLPEDYAQVAAMRYIEVLDYDEMAARLGLRREALRKRLHRANLMLRKALRHAFPELAEDGT